jgi:hypothetical protein
MCRMVSIFNWFSRKDAFLAMGICSLLTTVAAATPINVTWAPIVNLTTGSLLILPLPLLALKYFYCDPLDMGVIINEQAQMMNAKFPFCSLQWDGYWLKPGDVILVEHKGH